MNFYRAYDDLMEELDSSDVKYRATIQDGYLSAKMTRYMKIINLMQHSEFKKKTGEIYTMWKKCHSFIPIVLGFDPRFTLYESDKLTKRLEAYILLEHFSDLDKVYSSLNMIFEFSARHKCFNECFEEENQLGEVFRILHSYEDALDIVKRSLRRQFEIPQVVYKKPKRFWNIFKMLKK